MPFRSQEELSSMMKKDPTLARKKIAEARKNNLPVVSSSNTGYSDPRSRAIKKRLSSMSDPDAGSSEGTKEQKSASGTTYRPIGPRSRRLSDAAKARLARVNKQSGKLEGKIVTPSRKDELIQDRKRVGY